MSTFAAVRWRALVAGIAAVVAVGRVDDRRRRGEREAHHDRPAGLPTDQHELEEIVGEVNDGGRSDGDQDGKEEGEGRHQKGAEPEARYWDGYDLLAEMVRRIHVSVVIGVGDPAVRRRLGDAAAARGARFLTLVHPTAYVAPNARLGAGCVVCPFAFIGVGAVLGDHVAVNTYASVGHDAQVGDCSVFSPYAVVNGAVVLGEEVFLGTHATVTPRLTVGRSAKIAAGAVATRPVPAYSLAVGNPARSRVLYAPKT